MKLAVEWTDLFQVQQSPPDDAVELHLQSLQQSCSMWLAAVATDTVLQSVPSETFGCVDEFIGYAELLLGL